MQNMTQEIRSKNTYPIAVKFNHFLDLCKNLDDTWSQLVTLYFSKSKMGLFAVCSTRNGTIRAKISDQFLDLPNAHFNLKQFPKLSGNAANFSLSWDNKNLFISTKAGIIRVPLIENQFTNYAHFEDSKEYNPTPIHTFALLESLPAMLKIVQKDSIRNYGSVLHIEASMDNVRFVGTDGFRLAYYDFNCCRAPTLDSVNLTYDTVQFLAKLAKISKKEKRDLCVNCSEDKTTLFVYCGDIVASFRTSSVKFPQYKAILPNRSGYGMTVIRNVKKTIEELKPLLKLAGKHKVARFIGETKESCEDRLEVFGEEQPVGAINFNHGSKLEIRFNGKFFLDCLSTMPHDDFSLYTKNADEPIILESGKLTFLLVPVQEHKEEK